MGSLMAIQVNATVAPGLCRFLLDADQPLAGQLRNPVATRVGHLLER